MTTFINIQCQFQFPIFTIAVHGDYGMAKVNSKTQLKSVLGSHVIIFYNLAKSGAKYQSVAVSAAIAAQRSDYSGFAFLH